MTFAVAKNLITMPEHAVDGKLHRKTIYLTGTNDTSFGTMQCWGYKKDAVRFDAADEYVARRMALKYGAEAYPVPVGKSA